MASVSNDGYITDRISKKLSEVRKGSYTYFAEGDIIIAKITPCMENGKCAIVRNLENGIGFGSSEFHTFRCGDNLLTHFLFGYLNRPDIRKQAEKVMTGSSGHRRVPISFYENLFIPLPTIKEQEDIVSQVTELEQQIAKERKKLESLSGKTAEIMNRYLK